ncbi:hypothetical protein WJ71_27940 [Burkholderia ubonensis]|nr:hypothetical protein WJ71_27940 [Burkholderia ubonensis]
MPMLYKLTFDPDVVIRVSDGATVPCGHRFWSDYEAWVAEGNTPDPALTLSEAQALRIAALSLECQAAIVVGFASSALGAATYYPTTDVDQRNLQSSALAAAWNAAERDWSVPLWCRQGDAWGYLNHTAQQVQQVNADWVAFRTAAQRRYADAIAQVHKAASVDAAQAVVASA